MKIATIVGTRPEIIRLSRLIPLLDENSEHILVHTGQNFSARLSAIFFEQLNLREPNYHFQGRSASFANQVSGIFKNIEEMIEKERPGKMLILGDTNSGLSAIIAKRMGVPVYHMEAGNRCFNDKVPEECNRRVIDHASDILLPYTKGSKAHLLREGIAEARIFVSGNPIFEVISHYRPEIEKSDALERLGLMPRKFFLVTAHRAENVNSRENLGNILKSLEEIAVKYQLPVIASAHPHTLDRMEKFGLAPANPNIIFAPPFGFFDFLMLQQNSLCVITDSGTVQEEACILHVPSVIIRDVTERPETIACGSGILTGTDPAKVLPGVEKAINSPTDWQLPEDYAAPDVSGKVGGILMNSKYRD